MIWNRVFLISSGAPQEERMETKYNDSSSTLMKLAGGEVSSDPGVGSGKCILPGISCLIIKRWIISDYYDIKS